MRFVHSAMSGCAVVCLALSAHAQVGVCPPGTSMFDDPHTQGLRGHVIDWSGIHGGWYCLVTDDNADFRVNIRLTAPLSAAFPDDNLITGFSISSEGHSLTIEVTDPYDIDTYGCPRGISPCLANGGFRATVDGDVVHDLFRFSRNKTVAGGIAVSASNLPVECQPLGGDRRWTRMYDELLHGTRQPTTKETFEDWILRSHLMATPDWCMKYIAEHNLADVQSNHAVFKIVTSTLIVRLNIGSNCQGNDEQGWTGRVFPDVEFWQMDVGLQGLKVESQWLSGMLGETARPILDENGRAVMEGNEAFRGTVEDYRVTGSLGTDLDLLDNK